MSDRPPVSSFAVPTMGVQTYDEGNSETLRQFETQNQVNVKLIVDFNKPIEIRRADDFDFWNDIPIIGTLWGWADNYLTDNPSEKPEPRGYKDQVNDFLDGQMWSRMQDPTGNTDHWYWVKFPAELFTTTPEAFSKALADLDWTAKIRTALADVKSTFMKIILLLGAMVALYLIAKAVILGKGLKAVSS